VFRALLLTGLAEWWVVAEPLRKVDAIVVPGGKPELRAVEAVRLFHQGIAPRILYMDVKRPRLVELGIVPSEGEQTRRLLLSNNIPESAMIMVGSQVSNTHDESLAVRTWVSTNRVKSILIATDISHTRRARWVFQRELKGANVEVHVWAVEPQDYGVTNWWRHEDGLIAFENEVLKYIYYRFKY
jgi:uncharacterized SAM-binding protein YcdF (DUF218 family)